MRQPERSGQHPPGAGRPGHCRLACISGHGAFGTWSLQMYGPLPHLKKHTLLSMRYPGPFSICACPWGSLLPCCVCLGPRPVRRRGHHSGRRQRVAGVRRDLRTGGHRWLTYRHRWLTYVRQCDPRLGASCLRMPAPQRHPSNPYLRIVVARASRLVGRQALLRLTHTLPTGMRHGTGTRCMAAVVPRCLRAPLPVVDRLH